MAFCWELLLPGVEIAGPRLEEWTHILGSGEDNSRKRHPALLFQDLQLKLGSFNASLTTSDHRTQYLTTPNGIPRTARKARIPGQLSPRVVLSAAPRSDSFTGYLADFFGLQNPDFNDSDLSSEAPKPSCS